MRCAARGRFPAALAECLADRDRVEAAFRRYAVRRNARRELIVTSSVRIGERSVHRRHGSLRVVETKIQPV